MIDKFFTAGIRLKWRFPGEAPAVADGSMIDVPARASSITYNGVDGEIVDLASAPDVRMLGITKVGQPVPPHGWLPYAPGGTTRCGLGRGGILTGWMSGCVVALWTEGEAKYVCHVGTIVGEKDDPTNVRVKTTFAKAMPRTITGFDALAAWPTSEIAGKLARFKEPGEFHIMALVAGGGSFHSILLVKVGPDEWCSGGIKKVPPMDYQALLTKKLVPLPPKPVLARP